VKSITIKGCEYLLPMYLPDATRAVVKGVDSVDLQNVHVSGVVVNTYHLMTDPGMSVLSEFGGIKPYMRFDGLVTSDSGGWQIFSLIHRSKKSGKITDKGVTFSIGGAKRKLFSPEKSIQVQFDIGSDIVVCLDDFTPPEASEDQIKASVDRTILWAKRSREEYDRILEKRELKKKDAPVLLAVVQGGSNKDLRKYCAEKLIDIGFDGYGFGGYPMDADGNFDFDIAQHIVEQLPKKSIKFALGVGAPVEIAKCFELGWEIFDCTLPTRDGRHKRLYIFTKEPKGIEDLVDENTHDFIYIHREKYRRANEPISEFCDCYTCKNFTKAYLHHLFNINDTLAYRLASIHNIRTYTKLMQILRASC
jgi:queuine tRNA-ribosyltransferase